MSLVEKAVSLIGGPNEPAGTIHVVDRSALNWLYITYNTVEELVRVSAQGSSEPAAMQANAFPTGNHSPLLPSNAPSTK